MKTLRLTTSCFVLVAIASAACGGPANEFAGEWTESGTLEVTLNGRTLTGLQEFSTRVSETHAESLASSGCEIVVSIQGEAATVPSGHSCTIETGDGASLTLIYRTGTFTLDGDSMTHHGSGDALHVGDGKSTAGTFRYDSVLVKSGR